MFGLNEKDLEEVKCILKSNLPPSASVWVFGSRARGDHKKFSDLDILVSGEVEMKIWACLIGMFEESSLPIKVDLVLDSEFAESYRGNFEKEKIILKFD